MRQHVGVTEHRIRITAAKKQILERMSKGYRLWFFPMPDGTERAQLIPPGKAVDETIGRERILTEKGWKALT